MLIGLLRALRCLSAAVAMVAAGWSSGGHAAQFGAGWTLAGNGRDAVLDVPALFGTKSQPVAGVSDGIDSVWKWDAINSKWAFFAPAMDLPDVATYAAGKGYSVLKTIFPGEGYWVHARTPVTVADTAGQMYVLNRWQLASGWNLVSTGANVSPAKLNGSLSPFVATSIWARNPASVSWYFYAPSLSGGELASYLAQKGFLDFGSFALTDGRGFWVNRAAVAGSPTANLPPLDQAKQMFSELRTTFRSMSNDLETGALDGQARTMTADLKGIVIPNWIDVNYRMRALQVGTDLFRAVKTSQTAGYTVQTGAGSTTYSAWKNDYSGYNSSVHYPGSAYFRCATNAIGAAAPLSSVTCFVYMQRPPTWLYSYANGTSSPTYIYSPANAVTAYTSKEQFVRFVITETAADSYAVSATSWESTSGYSYLTSTAIPATTVQVGSTYAGTLQETTDSNGITQAMAHSAEMPALTDGVSKLVVRINGTRTLQAVGNPNSTYRYSATGSVAGVSAQGSTVFSYSLNTGSYADFVENALGQDVSPAGAREMKLIGVAATQGVRLDGTLTAKSVVLDADAKNSVPTDISFTGSVTDISPGGAGAILNCTVTAAISNYAGYHSALPESATNYVHSSGKLDGTLQLPSRPQMGLTLLDAATGPTTSTISGQYTYGKGVTITISGTDDSAGTGTLTFTNQDAVAVIMPDAGDGTISKAGTVLGTIKNRTIYYSDGTFESLD